MLQMVRTEVEISASVGGFSAHSGSQRHLPPDDENLQEMNCATRLYFHGELDGRPNAIEMTGEIL
jgi:hypothetical protein